MDIKVKGLNGYFFYKKSIVLKKVLKTNREIKILEI